MPLNKVSFFIGTLYSRIIAHLNWAGFTHNEYSIYAKVNTTAFIAWTVALTMLQLPPRGIMQTTLRRLAVFYAPQNQLLNVMRVIVPGGQHFARLAPTPIGLVPQNQGAQFNPPARPMQQMLNLPRGVRNSPAAWNPANWLTS
jgi:hypothetical protein